MYFTSVAHSRISLYILYKCNTALYVARIIQYSIIKGSVYVRVRLSDYRKARNTS